MDFMQMGTVLAIVVISYIIGVIAKLIPVVKDEFIPAIVGVAGGILGVVGMYVMPEFPANDILNAIAVGIVSVLASPILTLITLLSRNNSWCKLPYNDIMGFEKTIVLLRPIYSMIGCMKYKMQYLKAPPKMVHRSTM